MAVLKKIGDAHMRNKDPAVTQIRTELTAATTQSTNHYMITAQQQEASTLELYLCSFLRNVYFCHLKKHTLCFPSLFRNAFSVYCPILLLHLLIQHVAPGKQTKRNKIKFHYMEFSKHDGSSLGLLTLAD